MPFLTFKTKGEIPKGFEDVYEEKDGAFVPVLPDVAKVEETLTKVRGEKKDADRLAKEAGDKVTDLQRQLDVAKVAGGDVEKKTAELLDKWNKDKDAAVAKVQGDLDKVNGELRTVRLDDKLKEAFIAAGGRAEKAGAALQLTKGKFDLVDGQIVQKNDKGDVVTEKVADFFGKTYKTEMPEFYQGTKAAGGGATGGSGKTPSNVDPTAADRVIANPLQMLREANEANAA
ncbi:MAG TPA: hypothetical protein VGM50_22950 [Gemmatimonadaceae bacterium]